MSQLSLPFSVLSGSSFAPQSQQEAWRWLIRLVVWTPQLLWGLLALFIFSRFMRSHFRGQTSQWAFILPYTMVVGVMGLR